MRKSKSVFFNSLLFTLALFVWVQAWGVDYDPSALEFMRAETQNSYVPESTVSQKFRPVFGRTFGIKYLEIPAADLEVIDSGNGSQTARNHFMVKREGIQYIRFFIHPDSEHLYQSLIERYGVAGQYTAAATASTRTLLAWPKNSPEKMIFLKLSLAQQQDGLGRIIPGWEVRRSVGISEIASQTNSLIWNNSGASIVPEFAGAYVRRSENLPFYVDSNQGEVFEHGLIARSAEFLQQYPKDLKLPLFALFSEGPNGQEPLIIRLWKQSRTGVNSTSFVSFVGEYLFKPFLEKNKYLLFHQGIVPEFHGQNVVVVLDHKTMEIKHFFHRDVGSMKVDIRLRWVHGLSVDALRTENAQYDFKFERATTATEDNLKDYLNDWLFKWGYLDVIKKHIPLFSPSQTERKLLEMALETVRKELPLRGGHSLKSISGHLTAYYAENPPRVLRPIAGEQFNIRKVNRFVSSRERAGQIVPLPSEWKGAFASLPAVTEYGIVFERSNRELALALHASSGLDEIRSAKSTYRRETRHSSQRIGLFSGTFDPPHRGHEQVIREMVQTLNLDVVIVIPNLEPAHKPGATNFEARRELVRLAFASIPEVMVADKGFAKQARDRGVTNIIQSLAKQNPQGTIVQILGSDAIERYPEIGRGYPRNVEMAVMTRDSRERISINQMNGIKVQVVSSSTEAVSSTRIRNLIGTGKNPGENLLHPNVLQLIREQNLYRSTPEVGQCKHLFLGAG